MSSAASEAFRMWSSDLTQAIQEPDLCPVAWKLHSLGVVSQYVVEQLSVDALPPMNKKTKLFSAVENQINVAPTKFKDLIQTLRKEPTLKDVADKSETI